VCNHHDLIECIIYHSPCLASNDTAFPSHCENEVSRTGEVVPSLPTMWPVRASCLLSTTTSALLERPAFLLSAVSLLPLLPISLAACLLCLAHTIATTLTMPYGSSLFPGPILPSLAQVALAVIILRTKPAAVSIRGRCCPHHLVTASPDTSRLCASVTRAL
jgi:hypothetical protein